jgi:hypothetical protein
MDNDLRHLENPNATTLQKAIFNVVRGILLYPASIEAKAQKLADSLIFFCEGANPDLDVSDIFNALWGWLIPIASDLPPGHEWHQALIIALQKVREREVASSAKIKVYIYIIIFNFIFFL